MCNIYKRIICIFLSALIISSVPASSILSENVSKPPFADVSENDWYYDSVSSLYYNGVIPGSEYFYCNNSDNRGNVVYLLYKLFLCFGGQWQNSGNCPFADVTPEMYYYDAVCWGYEKGIASGVSDTVFNPEGHLTREQVCTFIMRYVSVNNVNLEKKESSDQFVDSLYITYYARSYVVACKMAGLINGYSDGYFYGQKEITRAETAAVVYTLLCNQANKPSEDAELVSALPEAYTYLYNSYIDIPKPFVALVPWSEPVELSYFDDVALVGDSVTLSLQYYCASSRELGNVTFLCAGSLSPVNALWQVSSKSVHPSYQGTKMTVEDGVYKSGVKKVYIMLGINSISMGVDNSINSLVTLIGKIKQKSPQVQIIIESVTPMTTTSKILSNTLTNAQINIYNSKLLNLCQQNGWYYLNVAEVFKDANGNLYSSSCSDANNMGIHFTYAADKIWIQYLRTHVPEALK